MPGDDVTLASDASPPHQVIDAVANAYESLWRSEKRGRIEDFLPRVPAAIRPQLLERLLRLELQLQSESGETFAVRDYRSQFPEYVAVIDSVLSVGVQRPAEPDQTLIQGSTVGKPASDDIATLRAHASHPTMPIDTVRPGSASERRLGEYDLLEEIARGGMGVVYKARQRKLNRIVAVKMILAGQFASRDDVQRFYSEAEAAARLDHPGIVPIYEVDEHEGHHFFSMGFVDGQSLQDLVARGPLPQRQAAALLKQVADAVHYAHQHGIVHRDLKPRNILLTADGQPRVTDFGLAKTMEAQSGLTVSGQILGTPGYMPPEQASGRLEDVGPPADVYALGAVLYCMLTGRPPFQSASAVETIKQVIDSPPASPRVLNPAIDRDLETICLKCLEKQATHRYGSAAELAAELGRYLEGEPIHARRIGPLVRSWRWMKRRPLVVALAVSLLLVATLVPVAGYVFVRSNESRRIADLQFRFDTAIANASPTESWLTSTEELMGELVVKRPEREPQLRERLVSAMVQEIHRALQEPRLTDESVVALQSAVALVDARDHDQAAQLAAELTRRLSDWQPLLHLASPEDDTRPIFRDGEVKVEAGRLVGVMHGMQSHRLVPLKATSDGLVQFEARFDSEWERATRIGVAMKVEDRRGYSFVLQADDARSTDDDWRPESAAEVLTFASIRARQGYFTLAIYRNGLLVLREQLAHTQVPGGPLAIRATCEQAELRLQVNSLPALHFRDPFPLPASPPGVFAVEWPTGVGVLELKAERKPKPEKKSPLEQGDELYEQGQFEPALAQYQRQEQQSSDRDFQQESQYKQALCLLQLGRLDDAASLFQELSHAPGQRWPAIAGCQLWVIRLRQQRSNEADSVFDDLSTRFSFDQVAALIPQELRREILSSYESDLRSLSRVLRYNPDLLTRVRRFAAIDRFLSASGRGRDLEQIEVARAYQVLGDLPSALQSAEAIARHTSEPTVFRHYLRLLRLSGDPGTALKELETYELTYRQQQRRSDLLVERARIYAAQQRWEECERTLDQLFTALKTAQFDTSRDFTFYALMKGMLLDRRGARGAAKAIWRQGYEGMRAQLERARGINTEGLNAIILGSLSNEIGETEAQQFFNGMVDRAGDNAILRQARSIAGPQALAGALCKMWQSKLGRQLAEDFAFERFTLRDRVKVPVVLLATEYFNVAGFAGEMSDSQREVAYEITSAAYDAAISDGKLTISQLAQLILTWKGTANFLGWGGVAPSLDPGARGSYAYLFAHRYLRLGNAEQAKKFLLTAIQDSPPTSVLYKLATEDLRLLEQQAALLTLESDYPTPVQVVLMRGDQTLQTIEVRGSVDVEVGAGEVGIATSPVNQEVRVALRKITVVPATRRLVKLQWLWRPTVDREVLPGHIPRPSENAVGARWQLVQRYPTQEPLSVAFDAAGAQFAVATSDRLIRIYQTADQQLVKMVGPTPRFPTKMIWGPSTDRLVVAGRDYRLQGFDVNTGQAVFRRGPSEGPIDGLCWNADASRFATGSWAHEHMARVFNANGGLIQAFSHANRGAGALAYASSGNWLAIHPTGGDERGAVELLRVGKAPPELLAAPNGQLPERLAISPNEQWLAAGSHSEAISVWRLSDGKLMHSLSVPGGRLLGLEWSHDGTRLIAGIDDRAIVEFDMVAAEPVELARYAVPLLRQFAVAADEVSLAAIADNQETFVINRQTREVKPLAMHHREQIALAIRPTGNHETAVVGRDGALRLFDSEGRQLLHSRAARAASLSSVVWTADGERIVASSADQRLIVWSADGSQQASYALPVVQSHQAVAAWQQDQVLVASRDGKVRVVRAADGSVVDTWTCSERPLATVATRGEQAVVSDNENRVTLRDAQGKETSAFGVTFGRAAFATAISPQGDCIALRGGDRNLQFYNLQGEKLAECDRSRDRTVDLAWSPSGKQLATSNYNGEIDVWSRDGEFQTSLAPASGGRSNQLVWVDEDHLLSVGEDGCLRHWNVKLRQAEDVTVLLSGGAWARYSPGGKLLDAEGEQNELAYVAENDRGGLDLLSLAEFRTRLGLSATEPASTPTTPTNPSGDRTPAVESVELPTRELAKLEDAAIAESSGLAASARDDAFWTHNDDETSPHLYLIGRDGKTLARFDVATDKQNDWEDMCRFHGDDADYLLIGDIGDNFARRDDCRLLLIKEPNLTDLDQVPRKLEVEAEIPYRFEDERHHDCEALAVDVARNVALLISKELDESCTLYEVPLAVSAEPQVAKRVRELKLPLVTSMDISPDGQRLVVLGGLHAFEWTKANSESWTTAMQRLPHRYVLPKGKQLEAIAYRRDGRALLLTTEGEHTPLWELTLP